MHTRMHRCIDTVRRERKSERRKKNQSHYEVKANKVWPDSIRNKFADLIFGRDK